VNRKRVGARSNSPAPSDASPGKRNERCRFHTLRIAFSLDGTYRPVAFFLPRGNDLYWGSSTTARYTDPARVDMFELSERLKAWRRRIDPAAAESELPVLVVLPDDLTGRSPAGSSRR